MKVLSSISNAFSRILHREDSSTVQNAESASIDELIECLVAISQQNHEGLRYSQQNDFLTKLIGLSKTSSMEKIWTQLITHVNKNNYDATWRESLLELMLIYKNHGYTLTKEMQQYLSANRYIH